MIKEISMRISQSLGVVVVSIVTFTYVWAAPRGKQHEGDSTDQDKEFLMKSAEGNMAEIELSKLALQKSQNDEVKQFAKKMVDDHTMLINDMRPFADEMGITPPSKLNPNHQILFDRLKGLSGTQFDKEYISAMVANHHNALSEFKAEESSTNNPDLKKTADLQSAVCLAYLRVDHDHSQAFLDRRDYPVMCSGGCLS
jgi:putative membrane protein